MSTSEQNVSPHDAFVPAFSPGTVSAIIPARNEEAVIATCIESLGRQPEISEIVVVDDQSTDGTAGAVRTLNAKYAHLRLLQADRLPDGWVGKNYALWIGVQQAKGSWLLLTDADAEHQSNSAVRVRMYRSFDAMWQGWKKNLYRLIGGTPWTAFREIESSLPWIPLALILIGLKSPLIFLSGVLLLLARQTLYGLELVRNRFPFS